MASVSLYPRRPSGELIRIDESGRQSSLPTLSCVHCQHTWIVRPGSGNRRGWCSRCGGPTCGNKACDTCVPFERLLESAERRAALHRRMAQELEV